MAFTSGMTLSSFPSAKKRKKRKEKPFSSNIGHLSSSPLGKY